MLIFLLTLHFVITLILIGLVLLQKDEESGSSSMYGGGMPQRRGQGHPLARATYVVGGLFFVNCLLMAWLSSGETKIVVGSPPMAPVASQTTSSPQSGVAPQKTKSAPAPAQSTPMSAKPFNPASRPASILVRGKPASSKSKK